MLWCKQGKFSFSRNPSCCLREKDVSDKFAWQIASVSALALRTRAHSDRNVIKKHISRPSLDTSQLGFANV